MITILNQKKDNIINCKDVLIATKADSFCVCEVLSEDSTGEMHSRILSTYPTEERAKEVVGEIWNQIKWGARTINESDTESYAARPYYEMPKE